MPQLLRVRALLNHTEPTAAAFSRRWGPAALLHLPALEQVDRALLRAGLAATAVMKGQDQLAQKILLMLRSFREMEVEFLPSAPQGTFTMGRDPACDLMVTDDSVSKHHATVTWDPRGYWVQDDGSRNGTFVNAVRLSGERKLMDGDTIGLGEAQLLFATSPTLFLQLESLRGVNPG